MKILTISGIFALSLVVLSACGSDEGYEREMDKVYRAECAKRGQGEAGVYEACRKALIRERNKKWAEENEEKDRKDKEKRKKEAEANR